MPKIRKIEPGKAVIPKRLRTCAYCRVSDGKDAMLHSLSQQISYYSDLIQRNPVWKFVQVYADEALTGTKDSRPAFQQMLADCRAGRIDQVITKSISRFARNTVTLLETVRELKEMGVEVWFQEQNIHSLSGDGELMLSVLASFAQEESLSVSENCKWRIKKKFEAGEPTPCKVFGYARDYSIIPHEASIVKQIFDDYLAGLGALAIQKKLLDQGIKFSINALRGILRSEKYIGNLLLQKSFVEDHLSKRKIKNDGQLPQYLVENHHEPIIDHKIWDDVQAEIKCRAEAHRRTNPAPAQPSDFTGLIRCGICGAGYRHKIFGSAKKYKKPVWICATFNTLGKNHCASQQIPEDILQAKTLEAGGFEGLQEILVPGPFALSFLYSDGRCVDLNWQHPSRAQSWTPEMREAARAKAQKGGAK